MLNHGLLTEVEHLFITEQIDMSLPAARAVGYRQMAEYILGRESRAEARDKSLAATRQLAKRQLTWMRRFQTILQKHIVVQDTQKNLSHFVLEELKSNLIDF